MFNSKSRKSERGRSQSVPELRELPSTQGTEPDYIFRRRTVSNDPAVLQNHSIYQSKKSKSAPSIQRHRNRDFSDLQSVTIEGGLENFFKPNVRKADFSTVDTVITQPVLRFKPRVHQQPNIDDDLPAGFDSPISFSPRTYPEPLLCVPNSPPNSHSPAQSQSPSNFPDPVLFANVDSEFESPRRRWSIKGRTRKHSQSRSPEAMAPRKVKSTPDGSLSAKRKQPSPKDSPLTRSAAYAQNVEAGSRPSSPEDDSLRSSCSYYFERQRPTERTQLDLLYLPKPEIEPRAISRSGLSSPPLQFWELGDTQVNIQLKPKRTESPSPQPLSPSTCSPVDTPPISVSPSPRERSPKRSPRHSPRERSPRNSATRDRSPRNSATRDRSPRQSIGRQTKEKDKDRDPTPRSRSTSTSPRRKKDDKTSPPASPREKKLQDSHKKSPRSKTSRGSKDFVFLSPPTIPVPVPMVDDIPSPVKKQPFLNLAFVDGSMLESSAGKDVVGTCWSCGKRFHNGVPKFCGNCGAHASLEVPRSPTSYADTFSWKSVSFKRGSTDYVDPQAFSLGSLKDLIRDKDFYGCFRNALVSEYAEESLDFYIAVERLHQVDSHEERPLILEIYATFLLNKEKGQLINITSPCKSTVVKQIQQKNYTKYIFDHAQEEVFFLMRMNSFSKFKTTTYYYEYLYKVGLISAEIRQQYLKELSLQQ